METIKYFKKDDYIETGMGNKISKKAMLGGSNNILLGGKTIIQDNCVVRGDLRRVQGQVSVVKAGQYCFFSENTVIRPAPRTAQGQFGTVPVQIGDYVFVGEGTIVEAAAIGSYVRIGKNCVIGKNTVLKDCCEIADDTVVPPNSVIPSFCLYGGVPSRLIDDLPECTQEHFETLAKERFANFVLK